MDELGCGGTVDDKDVELNAIQVRLDFVCESINKLTERIEKLEQMHTAKHRA